MLDGNKSHSYPMFSMMTFPQKSSRWDQQEGPFGKDLEGLVTGKKTSVITLPVAKKGFLNQPTNENLRYL